MPLLSLYRWWWQREHPAPIATSLLLSSPRCQNALVGWAAA